MSKEKTSNAKSQPEKPRGRYVGLVSTLWVGAIMFVLALSAYVWAVSVNFMGLFGGMPGLEKLFNPKSELASEIYTADNVLIGRYFRENRSPVEFDDLSPDLVRALIATEDVRFEEHSGIDFKATLAIPYYLAIGDKRGSSTLSQQLAKNLFDTRSEAYEGALTRMPGLGKAIIKTKEWITAIKLERNYTKKEIMTMYLNTVHFGSNAYGVKTAAATYFGKTPGQLTLPEAAVLVGVLKAPTFYSPILNPDRSLTRRNTVIDQTARYGFVSAQEAARMKALPIDMSRYRVENHAEGIAAYFRAELRKDLLAFCRENNLDLFSDGLKIYTTVDARMQVAAEEAMQKHMKYLQREFFQYWKNRVPWCDEDGRPIPGFISAAVRRSPSYRYYLDQYGGDRDSALAMMKRKVPTRLFSWNGEIQATISAIDSMRYAKHYLHAGLMSMDPNTGEVKAWVGGLNFKHFKYDHVRQGRRQAGSSFKPFVYCTAIDNGYSPCYELVDAPVSIYLPATGERWEPKNSDDRFTGERMTLRKAMAQSINSVAAQLIEKVGVQRVVDYAHRLGIESPLDPVPALALGSSDVSVYEMTGAYSTFVNKGTHIKPWYIRRIEDKNGNVLKTFNPVRREVLSEQSAYLMVHMLRGATTERNGTALGLHRLGKTLVGNEVGGKTGTTSNYSDGWFMGVTKDLVTGVWVGGDDRAIHFRSFHMGQGSRLAMPIWSYYMDKVYANKAVGVTKGKFERPKNLSITLDCTQWQRPEADSAAAEQTLQEQEVDFNQ